MAGSEAAPAFSVIVASRNRVDSLRRLLSRLRAISVGLSCELIVADNGSTDGTAALLESLAGEVRSVYEPRPGKSRALNRALALARGELFVFTDDDVEPEDAWLHALAAAAERHPDADAFGGRILVDPAGVPGWVLRSRLRQLLTGAHEYGELEHPYPANRFPIGPNMAIRRRALLKIPDPWPVELGPGCRVPVGDETALFYRLGFGRGSMPIYVPSARVRHEPKLEYFALSAALRRSFLAGYSAGLMRALYPGQAKPELRGASSWQKIAATRSCRELCCAAVRVAGYLLGRARGQAEGNRA